jgi:hypothetical protein
MVKIERDGSGFKMNFSAYRQHFSVSARNIDEVFNALGHYYLPNSEYVDLKHAAGDWPGICPICRKYGRER